MSLSRSGSQDYKEDWVLPWQRSERTEGQDIRSPCKEETDNQGIPSPCKEDTEDQGIRSQNREETEDQGIRSPRKEETEDRGTHSPHRLEKEDQDIHFPHSEETEDQSIRIPRRKDTVDQGIHSPHRKKREDKERKQAGKRLERRRTRRASEKEAWPLPVKPPDPEKPGPSEPKVTDQDDPSSTMSTDSDDKDDYTELLSEEDEPATDYQNLSAFHPKDTTTAKSKLFQSKSTDNFGHRSDDVREHFRRSLSLDAASKIPAQTVSEMRKRFEKKNEVLAEDETGQNETEASELVYRVNSVPPKGKSSSLPVKSRVQSEPSQPTDTVVKHIERHKSDPGACPGLKAHGQAEEDRGINNWKLKASQNKMDKIAEVSNYPWYWGALKREDAVKELLYKPVGTYLVRDGPEGRFEHIFTASFHQGRDKEEKVLHIKIGIVEDYEASYFTDFLEGNHFKLGKHPSLLHFIMQCLELGIFKHALCRQSLIWNPGSEDEDMRRLAEELICASKHPWYWGPLSHNQVCYELRSQPKGCSLVYDRTDKPLQVLQISVVDELDEILHIPVIYDKSYFKLDYLFYKNSETARSRCLSQFIMSLPTKGLVSRIGNIIPISLKNKTTE